MADNVTTPPHRLKLAIAIGPHPWERFRNFRVRPNFVNGLPDPEKNDSRPVGVKTAPAGG